jgi:hypothetical protein
LAASAHRKKDAPGGADFFVRIWVYRAVLAVRHALADVLATFWFLLAAIGWGLAVNNARPTTVQVLKSSGWLSWWTNDAMIPTLPAIAAATVFIMGLRVATGLVNSDTLRLFLLGHIGQAVLYLLVLLVAWGCVQQLPGGFLARYVPLAAAVYLPLRIRKRRSRGRFGRLRRPTAAGFRPSRRSVCTVRGWVLLDTVEKAYPRGLAVTTNLAEATMHEAAAYFRRRRDLRSAAYCMARGIDYMITHALLADTETVLRGISADPKLAAQPAVRVARASFLQAVGRRDDAHRELTLAAAARPAPPELRMLILESAIDLGSAVQPDGRRQPGAALPWSRRERLSSLWRRQVKLVVFGLIVEARTLAEEQPERAVELAYATARLPEQLVALLRSDDSSDAMQDLMAVRGLAFELVGDVAWRRGDFPQAAAAYLDAHQELAEQLFQGRRHLARAARCLTYAFTAAVRGGYDEPDRENHALDAIRAGLEILEHNRGLLREEEDRARWIAERIDVLDTVFDLITEAVRWQRAKAGELGVWLLESLHRTLTADLLAAEGAAPADPAIEAKLAQLRFEEARIRLVGATEARLPEEARDRLARLCADIDQLTASHLWSAAPATGGVDMADVYERLGDRVGLLYQCRRRAEGWRVNAALISREHGMRVHTALLPDPGPDPQIALWQIPCGALDVLAAGEPGALADLYYTPLGDEVWRGLAAALLPEPWWDALCAQPAADREIVVVPDGPIAGLPFSALPVRAGRPLLESAVVSLAPSLGALRTRTRPPVGSGRPRPLTVVTHMDDEQLHATSAELQRWRSLPSGQVSLLETRTADELERRLTAADRADIVSISVHGSFDGARRQPESVGRFVRLRDGAILSTRTALGLAWPTTTCRPRRRWTDPSRRTTPCTSGGPRRPGSAMRVPRGWWTPPGGRASTPPSP